MEESIQKDGVDLLDKSLRENYEAIKNWLFEAQSFIDQSKLEDFPWIEGIAALCVGLLACYLTSMTIIFFIRLVAFGAFNADRAAHWLAGIDMSAKRAAERVVVFRRGKLKIDRYEPNPSKAAKRRKEWQRKVLSEKEIQEIADRNRGKL